MNKPKKKRHGGLRFLAFLALVGGLIASVVIVSKTEIGQRITGNRQDRRLERTALTPRFAYTAAHLRITEGSMYNEGGTPVDLTTTSAISIDRPSATASSEVNIVGTPDEPRAAYTEILTKQYRYESPVTDGQPWFRWHAGPRFYGTPLDQYYVPMIDDIMGFELRDLPSIPTTAQPGSHIRAVASSSSTDSADAPSTVTTMYSYEIDVATFNRAVPILANRVGLTLPLDTKVALTIGFDDIGLLRFADISIPTEAATKQAMVLGPGRDVRYHYILEVTDISGESIAIEVPSDVVDAGPDTLSAAIPRAAESDQDLID